MHIVTLSDTHCQLEKIKVPDGDILLHSGDLTYQGKELEVTIELDKLAKLPHKYKIIIAGNHDWMAENYPESFDMLCIERNIIWLQNQDLTIEGINFYGSADQPEFCGWAFNKNRGGELKEIWDRIPLNTNVLITHSPPYGMGDLTPRGEKVGDMDLSNRIMELKELKYVISGHIHGGYGVITSLNGITYINASNCNEQYKPVNLPIEFDY